MVCQSQEEICALLMTLSNASPKEVYVRELSFEKKLSNLSNHELKKARAEASEKRGESCRARSTASLLSLAAFLREAFP